jgi:hypothetical protein
MLDILAVAERYAEDVIVIQSDTWDYWTYVEEYPMHLDMRVVLPQALARFLSGITFVSNGMDIQVYTCRSDAHTQIARVLESDEFVLPFTNEQIQRILEVYEGLLGNFLINIFNPETYE